MQCSTNNPGLSKQQAKVWSMCCNQVQALPRPDSPCCGLEFALSGVKELLQLQPLMLFILVGLQECSQDNSRQ
jgi:hypothetical protein